MTGPKSGKLLYEIPVDGGDLRVEFAAQRGGWGVTDLDLYYPERDADL